ncbi:RidA family protein [Candidatus Gottesmanbacteria bacterium]|nr:RidA family protein [Candidatus Gottesmanbacteria bacterium]MBI5465003.1 RidA family protein [Candidatus Gottesmanbacteria bacterium]
MFSKGGKIIKSKINSPEFAKISAVRNKYLKNSEPASTLVGVKKLVKDDCCVEIEVIAIKQK